jgi:hypothetical protein
MSPDVIVALAILSLVVTSALFGVTLLLSYLVTRCLRSDGWDKSNMTNALRLLSHVVLHPEDFAHMYYTVRSAGEYGRVVSRKAFPYINQDELSEVVKTRPNKYEVAP